VRGVAWLGFGSRWLPHVFVALRAKLPCMSAAPQQAHCSHCPLCVRASSYILLPDMLKNAPMFKKVAVAKLVRLVSAARAYACACTLRVGG
jgi:hypothetical protein